MSLELFLQENTPQEAPQNVTVEPTSNPDVPTSVPFQTTTEAPSTPPYREADGVSQSELKLLAYSPQSYFNKQARSANDQKDYFTVGSIVDTLINTDEDFDARYFVVDDHIVPAGKMKEMANFFLDTDADIDVPENLKSAQQFVGYQPTWGEAAVKKWFDAEAKEYVSIIRENAGKQVITASQQIQGEIIANSLKNGEYTAKYCNPDFNPEVNMYYQVEIYFEVTVKNTVTGKFEAVKCKSCLDVVIEDPVKKTLMPVDIKTTGKDVREFRKSAKDLRYDIQGASYTLALEYLTKGMATTNKLVSWTDYTILPFVFVVETTDLQKVGNPLPYVMSQTDLICGMHGANYSPKAVPACYGNPMSMNIQSVHGYFSLLEQLVWHRTTKIFNLTPSEYYSLTTHGALPSNIW